MRRLANAPRMRRLGRWLAPWRRSAEFTLAKRFGLANQEDRLFFLLIPTVGAISGLLGVAIHKLIDLLRLALYGDIQLLAAAPALEPLHFLSALAIGGVLVALVVGLTGETVSGKGMGMLIESVAVHGGRVPMRPVVLRAITAVATVGCGGSLGREGPMIRLGAALASQFGVLARLPPHRVRILLGCGAAAGLSSVYNIPIGGALFAMEVILGNFALEIFGPIVVSSVVATLIVRTFEGNTPIYAAADLPYAGGWEMLTFALLGIAGAVVALLFTVAMRLGREGFAKLGVLPNWLKPLLGMLLLASAVIATGFYKVLGSGEELIVTIVREPQPVQLLLLLALAKLLATALTIGSGGSGGLFTPSLAVGACLGAAFGHAMALLLPGQVSSAGVYAAVGMAAVAAGTTHAPISASLILFEFTGNYDLILPLMLAAILSGSVARALYPYSSYTDGLHRRGVDVSFRMEEAALSGLRVRDLPRTRGITLAPDATYKEVVDAFLRSHRQRLFVVDAQGTLVGQVSLHVIKHALDDPGSLAVVLAHDLMTPVHHVLGLDDRMGRLVNLFAEVDNERLPVIDPSSGRFEGSLAKRDLLAVYAQEVLGRPAMMATFVRADDPGKDHVPLPPDFALRMIGVPDTLDGQTLAQARLPQRRGLRVIQVKRVADDGGETRIVPDGDTTLRAGDQLVVIGPRATIDDLEMLPSSDGVTAGDVRAAEATVARARAEQPADQ
ncbi:MAG: chloride channel protein [Acidobacteriota bacterium]